MKYFFDNCISHRYAAMLRALDVDVQALREVLPEDTTDIELLKTLHGKDVVFVTSDTSMARRKAEARAVREAGVTGLFLGPFWHKMEFWDQAVWLVRRWRMVDGFASGVARGTCADVKQNGKSEIFVI